MWTTYLLFFNLGSENVSRTNKTRSYSSTKASYCDEKIISCFIIMVVCYYCSIVYLLHRQLLAYITEASELDHFTKAWYMKFISVKHIREDNNMYLNDAEFNTMRKWGFMICGGGCYRTHSCNTMLRTQRRRYFFITKLYCIACSISCCRDLLQDKNFTLLHWGAQACNVSFVMCFVN